jgi:hypothetical protein
LADDPSDYDAVTNVKLVVDQMIRDRVVDKMHKVLMIHKPEQQKN